MSFIKSHLKAAREHIGKKDYLTAKKEAIQVLDFEPDNYNAHVFLGLSHLELGEFEDSERIYQKATKLNPTQPLAWQGISSLYEKKQNWSQYAECLLKLMALFNDLQDAVKCAESLQKLVAVRRDYGSQRELLDSLANYLRESAFFTLLSSLPLPDPTSPTSTTTFEAQVAIHDGLNVLEEMISLTETLEEDAYKREVEKRRMRLGASSPDQLKKEVFRDISDSSQLPDLYISVLNHANTSDELRRTTESKLLCWKERRLHSVPPSLKLPLSQELDEMVDGIVLLNTPDELGWKIFFEGRDCEDISGYDKEHVRNYIKLFPDSTLASLFKGYFACMNTVVADDDEEHSLYVPTDVDPVDTLLDAYSNLSNTILGNRIMGEFYLAEEDYENSIKVSKLGLGALDRLELDSGKSLYKTRTGIQAFLSTSLVHFYPPKHHKQASTIIDQVLARSPSNIPGLMGQAFVQQAALKWKDAGATFDRVASIIPDDDNLGLRAREEGAWCKVQINLCEEGLVDLKQVLDAMNGFDDDDKRNLDRARCLWRIGKCYMLLKDVESAYKCFIKSLKQDSTFAPAFTSLGIYYNDFLSPPDPIRASKCFQKAFELDAREAVAARHLVEGFANDAEWDLVEVVAQRTIDGEGGVTGGLDKGEFDPTSRYLPTNSWAWKAVGVVKFHYRDYVAAIQSFQVALRVEPDDQNLWVHLGEAYSKAGRHVAALKALNYAHEMKPEDWICSFLIADVKQRMGLFEEAILILKGLRDALPAEAGILACLAKSHLDLGCLQLSDSFQIRAEESFVSAMQVALDMINMVPGFRTMAWKVIADAAFHLSTIPTFVNQDTARSTLQAINFISPPDSAEKLVKIIPPPSFQNYEPLKGLQIVAVAIHACLCQISLHLLQQTTDSTAWYDLSITLQSWILKAAPSNSDKSTAKDLVIDYLKQALQTDATNNIYWVALGNALFVSQAKAAQHAYIKALELDSKNSMTWVSLGLLYFYHGDLELANEVMYRAQVLDPDNTSAWVGQFLIALGNDHETDAQSLLQHAVGLTNPISEADYEFAFRIFKSTTISQLSSDFQGTLLPTFFLLNRYCRCRPNEESGLHLLALVCEKLGHLSFAETLVERSLAILETVYEETEDPEVERRYAIANATLGRLKLSQGDIAGSLTSFESVLGLLMEEDGSVDILRVQVHLGFGLAYFMQGDLDLAIRSLEDGLLHAGGNLALRGQITIVLAQVIWSIGTAEYKETAKSRVLECIASDPENLGAINILAGMGILTDDDGLVDAALSEVMALPIDQKQKWDSQRDVDYLLIQHGLSQGDLKHALSIAQHAVSAEPSSIKQRSRLASLIIQNGNKVEEALALLNGVNNLDDNGQLEAAFSALNIQAVAQASNDKEDYKDDALCNAQRAIFMRPSDSRGWQTLAYVRARMSLKLCRRG